MTTTTIYCDVNKSGFRYVNTPTSYLTALHAGATVSGLTNFPGGASGVYGLQQNNPDKSGDDFGVYVTLLRFDLSGLSGTCTAADLLADLSVAQSSVPGVSTINLEAYQYNYATPASGWKNPDDFSSGSGKLATLSAASGAANHTLLTGTGTAALVAAINANMGGELKILVFTDRDRTATSPDSTGGHSRAYGLQLNVHSTNSGNINPRLFITYSAGTAASGTASLSLSASATARAPESGTGSLSLTGTAAAAAPGTATASLALTGSTTAQAPTSATATLSLAGSATEQAPATATAALSLTAAASTSITTTATASLTLTGSVDAQAPAVAAGSITLTGTTSAAALPAAAANLDLTGTAAAGGAITATGHLDLTGTGDISTRITATAALTLVGTANATSTATALATLELTGHASAHATVPPRDITVTATLLPSPWAATVLPSTRTARLLPTTWHAHLEAT